MLITKNQKRLARLALEQPNKAFDNLFRYVTDPFWLETALDAALCGGAAAPPGMDGVAQEDISALPALAQELSTALRQGTYRPQPAQRVDARKADGTARSLGLAALRDRAVQEALRMVLEPILESRFLNCSTGFRPMRRAMDAIHLTTYFANNRVKMWWTITGTVAGGLDSIPHAKLLGVLQQHVCCRKTLWLIQALLHAGLLENGRVSRPNKGVNQAGLLAPLLLNVYLHELDKYWWETYGGLTEGQKTYHRTKGLGNVQFVRHADNLLVLTNGDKEFAHALQVEFSAFLRERLALDLAPEASAVVHLDDGLDFLGFHLQRVYSQQSAKHIVLVTPSKENIVRFKRQVREMTDRSLAGDDLVNKLRAVNQLAAHWARYYRHVNSSAVFRELSRYVHMRIYQWLRYKHANVSAHGSTGKYVIQAYLRRHPESGRRLFQVHGYWERPMDAVAIRRYRINWPEQGNPYLHLDEIETALSYREETPLPSAVWLGTSPQRQWAVARMERLEMVGHRCERCGSSLDLQAHHRVSRKDGGRNSVDNLEILCRECHQQVRAGLSKDGEPDEAKVSRPVRRGGAKVEPDE